MNYLTAAELEKDLRAKGGEEIKFCDESDFDSKDMETRASIHDAPAAAPLKRNTVKFQCDLPRPPAGEFEVRLLDSDKRVIESYVVMPARPE